jgi:regulator of replication initiation timing
MGYHCGELILDNLTDLGQIPTITVGHKEIMELIIFNAQAPGNDYDKKNMFNLLVDFDKRWNEILKSKGKGYIKDRLTKFKQMIEERANLKMESEKVQKWISNYLWNPFFAAFQGGKVLLTPVAEEIKESATTAVKESMKEVGKTITDIPKQTFSDFWKDFWGSYKYPIIFSGIGIGLIIFFAIVYPKIAKKKIIQQGGQYGVL